MHDPISKMSITPDETFKPWDGMVYLSGPMTGIPKYNYPFFNDVARLLRSAGFAVKNPAENFGGDTSRPRLAYMKKDIDSLAKCQRILLLPDWESSQGSCLEAALAKELGLKTFALVRLAFHPAQCMVLPITIGGIYHETKARPHTPPPPATILDKAAEAVDGPRREAYGHPAEDFGRAAGAISSILKDKLKTQLTAADIPVIMACVKLSRQANKYGEDNLVDLAGYARCAQMVHEYNQPLQETKHGVPELWPVRNSNSSV